MNNPAATRGTPSGMILVDAPECGVNSNNILVDARVCGVNSDDVGSVPQRGKALPYRYGTPLKLKLTFKT
jgi:hypothetical protein